MTDKRPEFKLLLQIDDPDLRAIYQPKVDEWNESLKTSPLFGDSGFDLFCPDHVECDGNSTQLPITKLVDLKVKAAAYSRKTLSSNRRPCSLLPSAYTLNVRSSIYKTKFRLANNVGIIDNGYRGNLKVAMDFYNPTEKMVKHNRYFQICMPTLERFDIEIVEKLETTERGEGGHGSTGN
jgi:dUTP pyrophosphatase|tara:strand:- start:96 stop:635 length:540 start_codon:yes stop_codon:yes gene_type:complete